MKHGHLLKKETFKNDWVKLLFGIKLIHNSYYAANDKLSDILRRYPYLIIDSDLAQGDIPCRVQGLGKASREERFIGEFVFILSWLAQLFTGFRGAKAG